jgi:RHS repeat-associated protein
MTSGQAALNFEFNDWLGTRRILTDSAGNNPQTCYSLPYGNGESCVPLPTEHLFTQKERDSETNNDYFDARYYASSMGRFLSADWSAKEDPVPYAKMDDPQSLNLYSYVENNPLFRTDPDGHCCWDEVKSFMDGASSALMNDEGMGGMAPEMPSGGFGQAGAALGNGLALTQAVVETAVGAAAAVGGDIEAGITSPAALTGAGAIIPAAGLAVSAAGVTAVVHGVATGVSAAKNIVAMGKLAKSATGKGSVPPGERDPQRVSTPSQKSAKLAEQGGKCANCEGHVKDGDGIGHHYPDRHADGGKDTVVVCKDCHKELHSGSN